MASIPGKQVENFWMSIRKSQAFCGETFKSILPSKIISLSQEEIRRNLM
jgi:hypothetical protein